MRKTMKNLIILILSILFLSSSAFAITIDGQNITGDFANATWTTYQDVDGDWGSTAQLLAMYVKTNETSLLIGIPAYTYNSTDNRGVCVFFDGNPDVGTNVMESGISSIYRLTGMGGLSFDTNFAPERVITMGIEPANAGNPGECYVDIGIIPSDSNAWVGTISNVFDIGGTISNYGITAGAFMPWPYSLEETNSAAEGIELSIPYEALNNSSPTVKVMAVTGNMEGSWLNNQTLPPSGGNTNWKSGVAADHHADLVPGEQFITIILPTFDTNVVFYASATGDKNFTYTNMPVIFTANASGGTSPYFYDWDLGDGTTTNIALLTNLYTSAGVFNPNAIISDSAVPANSVTVNLSAITISDLGFVNGLDIPSDFAARPMVTSVVQDTTATAYGGRATVPANGTQLDSMYAQFDIDKLFVGVCGNIITGNGDIVFCVLIDGDYSTGTNIMPLVNAGSPPKMQRLEGMTFDSDFTPDKAILFSVNALNEYWVNFYDINGNSEIYWGDKTEWENILDPFQRVYHMNSNYVNIVAFNDSNIAGTPDAATTGLEFMLDIDTIGYQIGQGSVRLQAIMYNHEITIDNVINQSLPGINGDSLGYGTASNVNYNAVAGNQYIEVNAIPEPGIIWIIGLLIPLIKGGAR